MADVRARTYPAPEHTVYMNDKEVLDFANAMHWDTKLQELEREKVGS